MFVWFFCWLLTFALFYFDNDNRFGTTFYFFRFTHSPPQCCWRLLVDVYNSCSVSKLSFHSFSFFTLVFIFWFCSTIKLLLFTSAAAADALYIFASNNFLCEINLAKKKMEQEQYSLRFCREKNVIKAHIYTSQINQRTESNRMWCCWNSRIEW